MKNVNSVAGNSFLLTAYGSNFGSMFIILKDFSERQTPELQGDAIWQAAQRFAEEVPEAIVSVFPPPAVSGLGRAGGFKLMVEDRGDVGLEMLQGQTDNLVEQGNQQSSVTGLFTVLKRNSPQLFVDVDREKVHQAGSRPGRRLRHAASLPRLALRKRFQSLRPHLAGDRAGRCPVPQPNRGRAKLKVRNAKGDMVPLGAVARVQNRAARSC